MSLKYEVPQHISVKWLFLNYLLPLADVLVAVHVRQRPLAVRFVVLNTPTRVLDTQTRVLGTSTRVLDTSTRVLDTQTRV